MVLNLVFFQRLIATFAREEDHGRQVGVIAVVGMGCLEYLSKTAQRYA